MKENKKTNCYWAPQKSQLLDPVTKFMLISKQKASKEKLLQEVSEANLQELKLLFWKILSKPYTRSH